MRLLYVIDSIGRGGAETSLGEMAPGLVKAGIDLHVVPLDPSRTHQKARLDDAGAVTHLRTGGPGRVANVRTVMDIARRVRPDAVHTTLFESDIAGRTAALLRRVPSSTSIVNDSYSPSHYAESNHLKLRAAQALDASTGLFAARYHSITQAIAASVGPRMGIPQRKIDVIPRGRDPHAFPFRSQEARRRIRAELQLPEASPVVLAVGRHEPQKGLQHLLAALPTVAAAHPGLVLLVAGRDGRSTPQLRSLASGTGVDVRFLGHRTDVADLLAAADVFCFPSEREGFGGVLIEAMAVGCPVVASDIPTSVEVLGGLDGIFGAITPMGDSAALAEALVRTLADTAATESLVARARTRFEEHYTIDKVVEQMAAFFRRVADSR